MIRLTDEQWERIRSHFPEEHIADGRPGRKPIPTRRVLEAVLWLLNTGAQWHMLPLDSHLTSLGIPHDPLIELRGLGHDLEAFWRVSGTQPSISCTRILAYRAQ